MKIELIAIYTAIPVLSLDIIPKGKRRFKIANGKIKEFKIGEAYIENCCFFGRKCNAIAWSNYSGIEAFRVIYVMNYTSMIISYHHNVFLKFYI